MPPITPKPMPDFTFRLMVLFMKIEDILSKPSLLLNKIPLKRGMIVVDYACGPGRYTIPIAKIVGSEGKVYAVDIQHLAIETIKRKIQNESLTNIEPILLDGFDTGIATASADLVLLIDALILIRDRESLFHEIHRLLKPDGFLFLDASHMRVSTAEQSVKNTCLFKISRLEGKTILLSVNHDDRLQH